MVLVLSKVILPQELEKGKPDGEMAVSKSCMTGSLFFPSEEGARPWLIVFFSFARPKIEISDLDLHLVS